MTREDNSEYTQMISEKLVEHILFSRFHTVTMTREDNSEYTQMISEKLLVHII